MGTNNKLYLAKGKLTVVARGYWFTSGGDKGSFGYYPHLKDKAGYPVFPDTQLHGDLRMAANWLSKLSPSYPKNSIKSIFGDYPGPNFRDSASSLFLTDLKFTDESREKWLPERFEVKPRIEIDDAARTVKEHMLVSLEYSYLDGLKLQSDIYLGYHSDQEYLASAKSFIKESAEFLSGFGAFRSRGYGRGTITVDWEENDTAVEFPDNEHIQLPTQEPSVFLFALESLINMRNKPIDPGSTQHLPSHRYIQSGQFRGWFVKTYYGLFGVWPSQEEMSEIVFPDLYPSIVKNGNILQGFPPPMTTLKNEKGDVFDTIATPSDDELRKKGDDERENFFQTKTKPLSSDYGVTNEENPSVFSIETGQRIRNTTNENFSTFEEGGLFVQEFIREGTIWAGEVKMVNPDSEFAGKARFILNTVMPVINGCLLSRVKAKDIAHALPNQMNEAPRLVISPIPYSERLINFQQMQYAKKDDRITKEKANIIGINTRKSYNTVLKRPRRPGIVISPGSVIHEYIHGYDGSFRKWNGFVASLAVFAEPESEQPPNGQPEKPFMPPEYLGELAKKMTRAQIGMLKEFTNKSRKLEDIKKVAVDRRDKFKQKDKKEFSALYGDICSKIDLEKEPDGHTVREFVSNVLDTLFETQWEKKYGR